MSAAPQKSPSNTMSPRFSLAETLAWIAWGDSTKPVGQAPMPEFAPVESGTLAPELRPWWEEEARRENDIRTAADKLKKAIETGVLSISGHLVTAGSLFGGTVDWKVVDQIPDVVTRTPCEISKELIERHGGCLIFHTDRENDLDHGPTYCYVKFDASQVKNRWQLRPQDQAALVACITQGVLSW